MKKLFVTLCLSVCAIGAFAQGQVNLYSNGKNAPIYGVKSGDETAQAVGNSADYSGRNKLAKGAWVELWYAVGANKTEADLQPLAGSIVEFSANGVFAKSGVLNIAGTFGGDTITVQLRAWGGSATSFSEAIKDDNTPRGKSEIKNLKLGGLGSDGSPNTPASLVGLNGSFGLYVVPEPSVIALGALGLGALVLRRRK